MKIQTITLCAALALLASCDLITTESETLDGLSTELLMEVRSADGYTFMDRKGAVYKDEYLVWAKTPDNKIVLEVYDLKSQEKVWEHSPAFISLDAKPLNIHDNYLFLEREDRLLSIIDLDRKEVVATYRYNDFSGDSPPNLVTGNSYFDGTIYQTSYNNNARSQQVKTIDIVTGEEQTIFYREAPELHLTGISPPSVFRGLDGKLNMLILSTIRSASANPEPLALTLLINSNEDGSINWIDTLHNNESILGVDFSAKIVADDFIYSSKGVLASIDKHTGETNWSQAIDWRGFAPVFAKEEELYFHEQNLFSKLDPHTGDVIWQNDNSFGSPPKPNARKGFEIYDDMLVFNYESFYEFLLLDKETGSSRRVDYTLDAYISFPILYPEEQAIISHAQDKIVVFKLTSQ